MTVFYKVITTLWLFLIIQTASSPLKEFIDSDHLTHATRPFADKYIYVDKTSHAQKLCEVGGRYFFVRPRRFGKTTFLRSLQRIFDGTGRGIFNGTHIHNSNYSWDSYPVLYIDFGLDVAETKDSCKGIIKEDNRTSTLLELKVFKILKEFKAQHKLTKPVESRFSDEFASVLEEMHEINGKLTVVLADEYDYGILNNHVICPRAEEINSELLKAFFLRLKCRFAYIRFAFVTGISKSMFSSLGSQIDLKDITDSPMYHDIAGITESDLNEYYGDHMAYVTKLTGKPKENITSELKHWYDGYKFSLYAPSAVYNPMSVHEYLQKGIAKAYWCDKAHATFLYNQMVHRMNEFMRLDLKNGVSSYMFGGTSLNTTDPVVLIYDAGYLTIESCNNGVYELRFANEEMEETFYRDMSEAAKRAENGTIYELRKIQMSLQQNDGPAVTNFMDALDVCMMKVGRLPFEEWYDYQTMKFIKDAGLDANRQTTLHTNDFGKKIIDVTAHSENTQILIEVKFNRRNNYDAWAAVNKSIKATLDENRQKATPFQYILAAGITFTQNDDNHAIDFYQAKLFAKNGKVIRSYQSENILQYQSERLNHSTQRPPLFFRDDLFLTNETLSSEFDDYT